MLDNKMKPGLPLLWRGNEGEAVACFLSFGEGFEGEATFLFNLPQWIIM